MPIQEMSLPQDLAWRRLAASEEMMDPDRNDAKLPARWRSSLAIFYADAAPADDYCDRIITYLKVVCTLTGYQLGDELGYDFKPPSLDAGKPQRGDAHIMVPERVQLGPASIFAKAMSVFAKRPAKRERIRAIVELPRATRLSSRPTDIRLRSVSGAMRSMRVAAVGPTYIAVDLEPESTPADVGVSYEVGDLFDSWGVTVLDNFRNTVEAYRPCHGAMLQVSVYPGPDAGARPLEDYPYIVAFEPKKRELYETVTDTGEVLSGSTSSINVRKGSTTTAQTENSDVLTGVNVGTEFTYAGTGGGANVGVTGEWGSRQRYGTENVNVTTTDSSREKRETVGHATSLSQLYTLLQSYHLATNRCLFLMLPRPHQKQQGFMFANGPRELEGVQEFFLVVSRPASQKGLCVSALLETAHVIDKERSQMVGEEVYGTLTPPIVQPFNKSHSGKGWAEFQIPVSLPSGYVLDRTKGDQGTLLHWTDHSYSDFHSTVEVTRDESVVTLIIRMYDDENEEDPTRVQGELTVYGRTADPISTPQEETWVESDLVMTGRRISGCVAETAPAPAPEEVPPESEEPALASSEEGAGDDVSDVTADDGSTTGANEDARKRPASSTSTLDDSTREGPNSDGERASRHDESNRARVERLRREFAKRAAESAKASRKLSSERQRKRGVTGAEPLGNTAPERRGEQRDALADHGSKAGSISLTFETTVRLVRDRLPPARSGLNLPTLHTANALLPEIRTAMIQSVGSPRRYTLGTRSIGTARYIGREFARSLARLPSHDPMNVTIDKVIGRLHPSVRRIVEQLNPKTLTDLAKGVRLVERAAMRTDAAEHLDSLYDIILDSAGLKRK